jgi:thiol-disulfide isomerase/thioredoxin
VTSADLAAGGKDLGTIEVACRVGPRVGENMQAYAFVDETGRQQHIADLGGRLVLLHVWASWCAPCLATLPELVATADELADAPVTLIGLNIDADAAAGERMATARGLVWAQNYLGEDSTTARQLAVSSAPAYFLIGADGKLLRSSTEWEEIKAAINAALEGDSAGTRSLEQ